MYTQNLNFSVFQRRTDLTSQKRMLIAYLVLFQNSWGIVSRLGRKYNVSRQFIYNLVEEYKCFGEPKKPSLKEEAKREESIKAALSLRLEAKSSIESISTVMQRMGFEQCSVGFVSQILSQLGKQLDNKINTTILPIKFIFCCDEIFAKQTAILITVEPISLMILSIELAENRKADSWQSHWQDLLSQGCVPLYIAKDEGLGMKSAQSALFSDISSQSDTFHAVAHRLGLWSDRLEKAAYNSINAEWECLRLLANAKTDKTSNSRKKSMNLLKSKHLKLSNCMKVLNFSIIAC